MGCPTGRFAFSHHGYWQYGTWAQTGTTLYQCAAACENAPDCTAFDYKIDSGDKERCHIYTSVTGDLKPAFRYLACVRISTTTTTPVQPALSTGPQTTQPRPQSTTPAPTTTTSSAIVTTLAATAQPKPASTTTILAPVTTLVPTTTTTTPCAPGDELKCFVHQGHCSEGWLGVGKTKNFATLTKCYQYCLGMSECGYISYDEASQRCSTYSPWQRCPTDGRYLYFQSFRVRGPGSMGFAYKAIHAGHCNSGWINGQNRRNVVSADACALWCADYPVCRYFSFGAGTCALYSAYGRCGDDGRYPRRTAYAVVRDGENNYEAPSIKPYYYLSDGSCALYAATGTFITTQASLQFCVNACYNQDGGCGFFSFNLKTQSCMTFNECKSYTNMSSGYVSYKIVLNTE